MSEAEWSEWIEWKGGECPVDGGETVRVLREGQIVEHETQARNMRWVHFGPEYGDIIAYRVKRTQAQSASANATQVGGTHYKDKSIQPWDFIASNGIGFFEGNAIKYLTRWREKGGIEDLKKARHYLDKLIEVEGGNV